MAGLLSRLRSLVTGAPDTDPILDVAVERAVYQVAPRLKQFHGYPGRYRPAVQRVLARVRQLSADVPGPVTLDPEHYSSDPFVHALFGAAKDIKQLFSTPAMRAYVTQHGSGECYALLSMRRVERLVLGLDLDGDVLRRDVAQRVIDFADQQLIAPAPTENEARENLLWYLFDRYMDHVAQGLDRLRDERQRLSREKAFAAARLHGVSDEQRVVRQQELDSVLEDLSEASATLDLEHLGEVFEVVLSHPEDCLRLVAQRLSLDAMGIVHADATYPGVVSLDFVDLHERDRETRNVVLVHCREVHLTSSSDQLEAARQLLG
ncbi:MAG: hypothetical protein WBP86_02800 [Thiobacillaceae bacterium]